MDQYRLTLLMLGNIKEKNLSSADFFQTFSEKKFEEYHQGVKHIGYRSFCQA